MVQTNEISGEYKISFEDAENVSSRLFGLLGDPESSDLLRTENGSQIYMQQGVWRSPHNRSIVKVDKNEKLTPIGCVHCFSDHPDWPEDFLLVKVLMPTIERKDSVDVSVVYTPEYGRDAMKILDGLAKRSEMTCYSYGCGKKGIGTFQDMPYCYTHLRKINCSYNSFIEIVKLQRMPEPRL